MGYYIRMMREQDVSQVSEIDREAFPTQWPAPNYRRELHSGVSHYVVACENSGGIPGAAGGDGHKPEALSWATRIRRWFGGDHAGGADGETLETELVVGFAGIWVISEEAHITSIAVREKLRGRGIGELLMMAIIDLARKLDARTVTLEVRVSNSVAQSLYTKFGFSPVGTRRGYYTDNREDALLMSTEDIFSETFLEREERLKQEHASKWGESRCEISG
ncbi:MAG: ribosomal protein S18-alanine N-acetyltransferase [Chloroflexi bacterium]|nr:ribosomal protein S18-alanine N-acetyltransferase [Chloroflexota bacterium]